MSFSQLDDTNDASIDNVPNDVPFVALNAVMNMSFNAVLGDEEID